MEEFINKMNNKEIEYEKKNNTEKRENYINILNEYRNFNNNLDKNSIFKEPINSLINSIETKKDCLFFDDMNDKNFENSFGNKIYLNFRKKQEEKSSVIKLKSKRENIDDENLNINNQFKSNDFEIIEKSNIKTILDKIQNFKKIKLTLLV